MKEVVLYISMSLDGYIASENGSVDQLKGDDSDSDSAGSYPEFIETIDVVLMKYAAYHQVITELSANDWPYEDKMTYVLTHKNLESTENIIFTDSNIEVLLNELKLNYDKDIWICGGASVVNQLISLDLIDKYCIQVLPIIKGTGIPLFDKHEQSFPLKLKSTKTYNGIVDLVYRRKQT